MSSDARTDLAHVLHEQHGGNHCPHWATGSFCERWADSILASDWLANQRSAAREQGRAEGDAEWAAAVERWLYSWSDATDVYAIAEMRDTMRALLTADRTKALDAVKAQAAREAGERIAQAIEAGRTSRPVGVSPTEHAAHIARADRNPNGGDS